jgi:hypothetical protein
VTRFHFVLFLACAGCGGRSTEGSADDTHCVPGRQTACDCPNGTRSFQICADDGLGLLECQCGAASSGASSGGAASGGSSGIGGANATEGSTSDGVSSGGSSGSGATPSGGALNHVISFHLKDAEYSSALDRVVLVSTEPAELHIMDPFSVSDTIVALPLEGNAISVAPDGLTAVVGHDGWVTEVDLVQAVILQTAAVSADALDVVLAPNHYAYVFPERDQHAEIRSMNLTTGEEEEAFDGMSIYAGTLGKLQPGKLAMYGADNGLSPSDIEKYDISEGPVRYLYDSPYHGDYYMCGDLWFSEDGKRIFTRCGNVFAASDDEGSDMHYAGSLGVNPDGSWRNGIAFLSHSLAAQKLIAIVGNTVNGYGEGVREGDEIVVFEDEFLNREMTHAVSSLEGSPAECSHVFIHSSGMQAFAVCSGGDDQRSWVAPLPL